MKYSIEDIESAYRKFKNNIYYSTGNLYYRKKIAEFECSDRNNISNKINLIAERKLRQLMEWLNKDELNINRYRNKIKFHAIPKGARPKSEEDSNESSVTHNTQTKESIVDRVTYLIDVPVEIHIISTMWVIANGMQYQKEYTKYNYGNILTDQTSLSTDSLRLFRPYFYCYQKWRDNSISVVRDEVKSGNNVTMISLDVKNFYDSCRVTVDDYLLHSDDDRLGRFLFEVSKIYYKEVGKIKFDHDETGLPIGLLSSAILANYYLKDFDTFVAEKFSPAYYGRYVDDIVIVKRIISSPSTSKEIEDTINSFVKQLYITDGTDGELMESKGLLVQPDKVLKYYFDSTGPTTLLDKFEKEIRQNSSEFRFLPESSAKFDDFLDSAYAINYSGSKQKFRSIAELSPDKFGVSTFLAKRIYSALTQQEEIDKKIGRDIISFFTYTRAIEFYSLWEKAFTYFVVIDDKENLLLLENNILDAILNTTLSKDVSNEFDLQGTLKNVLESSIGMALSLNPGLYDKHKEISVKFLMSNMTRHKYVALPLMSYIAYDNDNNFVNLTDSNYFQITFPAEKSIDEILRKNVFKFSPRYIPFHEVVIFKINMDLFLNRNLNSSYLGESFILFYKLNYYIRSDKNVEKNNHFDFLKSQYFTEENLTDESQTKLGIPNVTHIILKSSSHPNKINIGIGNIELDPSDIYQSLIDKPIANKKRKDRLFSIINQATKEGNVDFLILPEASVPCRWFDLLADKARSDKLGIVFGLEHLVANGCAYNLIVNLLPVEIDDKYSEIPYVAVVPIVRIKNHYSPSEIEDVEGYHHKVPIVGVPHYHLITWRNIYFTTFNCFELTNIIERGFFRSRIDILFACEYNADVNYYSNLVESSARDLHCYVVQSNSSYYGDSRITQPTKTETKDILKIKGGMNATVLIGSIRIEKLRRFQYQKWNLQLKNKQFKPTPPGFNRDLIANRLNIKIKTT